MFTIKPRSIGTRMLLFLIPVLSVLLLGVGLFISLSARNKSYNSSLAFSDGITSAAEVAIEEWLGGCYQSGGNDFKQPGYQRDG